MKHLTVLKYSTNDRGYVQCVIKDEFIEEFTAMGFVKHIDDVKRPQSKRKKATKDGD